MKRIAKMSLEGLTPVAQKAPFVNPSKGGIPPEMCKLNLGLDSVCQVLSKCLVFQNITFFNIIKHFYDGTVITRASLFTGRRHPFKDTFFSN